MPVDERGGGRSVRDAELAVDALEVLRNSCQCDPEVERDRVVLQPARDVAENLALARGQLLDTDVSLVEEHDVDPGSQRDADVQAGTVALREELAAGEQPRGQSALDPQLARKQRPRGGRRVLDHASARAQDDEIPLTASAVLDGGQRLGCVGGPGDGFGPSRQVRLQQP